MSRSYAHDMQHGTEHRRVLVVEDEPVINDAVADRLRAEGFHVDQAYDGPGAVSKAAEVDPELVVLDVMLPASTGTRSAAASRRPSRCRC